MYCRAYTTTNPAYEVYKSKTTSGVPAGRSKVGYNPRIIAQTNDMQTNGNINGVIEPIDQIFNYWTTGMTQGETAGNTFTMYNMTIHHHLHHHSIRTHVNGENGIDNENDKVLRERDGMIEMLLDQRAWLKIMM